MTNLFISVYDEKNTARRKELENCLLRNCRVFDTVFALAEKSGGSLSYLGKLVQQNVMVLPVTLRPTFRTFFCAINAVTGPGDVNVIANSDIYFEEIAAEPLAHQCFALTRYEVDERRGRVRFLNRNDSQDAWMFRGQAKPVMFADFHLGVPGCDNRINMELKRAGYEVINPSLTVKAYHLHQNPSDHSKAPKRVGPPYLRLSPIAI